VAAERFVGGRAFMTSPEDRERQHLHFMFDSVELALSYIEGYSRDDFLRDKRTQQAVILNLLHLGEAANRLVVESSDVMGRYPRLPWSQMRGMRNRLAHGYFDINIEVVWSTLDQALPDLRAQLREICRGKP
jgi:uncharacterized protein with HEPN domain